MIRAMRPDDKDMVMTLIRDTAFFVDDEVKVAEELIDVYLNDPEQRDYRIVVIEDDSGKPVGYLTWGPTPLTEGHVRYLLDGRLAFRPGQGLWEEAAGVRRGPDPLRSAGG